MEDFISNTPRPVDSGLSVKGVTKTFDSAKGPVLRNIDLDVPPNSFFALLGPSGCGKSTLLRIIAGLETPDKGSVVLDGEDISSFPPYQRKVNTVFQNFALFPHMNVRENIAFGLKARGIFEDKRDLFLDTIESLELKGLEDRYPDQLSGGQQQRVALARALVNEPRALLLDEPMSHLDEYLKGKVSQDLLRLQRQNGTIFLMVTHDREEAMNICNGMAILNEGRIVQQDKPSRLFFSPRSVFVAEFMGKLNIFDGEIKDRSVVLPFYSDGESFESVKSGKILINPELISVRKQKKEKKSQFSLKGAENRAAVSGAAREAARLSRVNGWTPKKDAEEDYGSETLSLQLVSNGDYAAPENPSGGNVHVAPRVIRFAKSAKGSKGVKGGKLSNHLQVNATVSQVRYRGYATELHCSVPNTETGRGSSTIQVITSNKESSFKEGDGLVLSINKKHLKMLSSDGGPLAD
ncbi:MAG: ABC transporter ATP-binding protein [Deltaproteobacteria bacterium]|nr:ABC transporter ATP-binding protein [Deltaproteobacteria bacterium]